MRVGTEDVTRTGLPAVDRDVQVVINDVAVRRALPTVRGRVTGFASDNEPTRVELSGPIVDTVAAGVKRDGLVFPMFGQVRTRLASPVALTCGLSSS